MPPDPAGAPPLGSLLLLRDGAGPTTFAIPQTALAGRTLTVRLACTGTGPARLTDANNRLILQEGGCTPYAVYSAGPFEATAARSSISLTIDPASRWRIAVYVGGRSVNR